jgi:hypothetical protein
MAGRSGCDRGLGPVAAVARKGRDGEGPGWRRAGRPAQRRRRGRAPGDQQPQPGPASVADGKLRVGDLSLSADDIKSIMAEKAQRDSRAANTPKDAAGFDLSLPADFVLPPGVAEWKWDTETPTTAATLGAAKNFAFEHGLDQPAFSKLLALYASHEIAEQNRFNAARAAEVGKLGTNAAARIDSVNVFLESQVGSELAGELRRTMVTSGQVKAYEKLMRNFSSQGVSGNPAAARDGAGAGPERVSDEAYNKMSYAERQAYAARFDQRQFNGRG